MSTDYRLADRLRAVADEVEHLQDHVAAADAVIGNFWIPVSERLPPDTGFYLTSHWSADLKQQVVWICEWRDQWGVWRDDYYGSNVDVTHWQPLPEPPERTDEVTDGQQ